MSLWDSSWSSFSILEALIKFCGSSFIWSQQATETKGRVGFDGVGELQWIAEWYLLQEVPVCILAVFSMRSIHLQVSIPNPCFQEFLSAICHKQASLGDEQPIAEKEEDLKVLQNTCRPGSTLSGFLQNLVWHLLQPITFVVHFVFQVVLLWVLCVFVSLLISGQATFRASVQLQSLERASRDHQLQADQAAWCPETWNLNLFKVFFLNWTFQAFLCSHGWKAWS